MKIYFQGKWIHYLALGYLYPNALMQSAMADLDTLCIDVEQLQHRHDWLVREMTAIGYTITAP